MRKQKSKTTSYYFDDCLICQEMEKSEKEGKVLTLEETKNVFARQNLLNESKDKKKNN